MTPGLLAVVPAGVTAVALGVENSSAISTMIGLVITAGAPVLLMDFVRNRGLTVQERLYRQWGGAPTTQLLRLTESKSSPTRRDHWRERITTRASVDLPTAQEETADPTRADEKYGIATTWAREQTRENPVVLEENRNYGFHRNLLGMRSLGVSLSGLSVVMAAVAVLNTETSGSMLVAASINLAMLVFWIVYPSESRVEVAAFRYATRLFDAATS